MIWAMHILIDLEGSCGERKGSSVLAHGLVQLCQIVEGCCSAWMMWPPYSLTDLEGSCDERKGSSMVAHGLVQGCQIVEGGCSVRMIWAQHSLTDIEGSCVERKGSGMIHIHTKAIVKAVALKGKRTCTVWVELKHLVAELDGLLEQGVSFICHRLPLCSSVDCPSVGHQRLWSGRQLGSAQRAEAGIAKIVLVQLL